MTDSQTKWHRWDHWTKTVVSIFTLYSTQPKIFWSDTVHCQKVLLRTYFRNWIRTAVASGQYQISTHISVSDRLITCLRAVFVELIQSCRTDTDTIYSSVSDPLPKSSISFLGTDLDQIGSSSDSKRTILVASFPGPAQLSVACSTYWKQQKAGRDLGTRLRFCCVHAVEFGYS